jgi:hypothetical protein
VGGKEKKKKEEKQKERRKKGKKGSPVPSQSGEDLVPSAGFLVNPAHGHMLVSKYSGIHDFVGARKRS